MLHILMIALALSSNLSLAAHKAPKEQKVAAPGAKVGANPTDNVPEPEDDFDLSESHAQEGHKARSKAYNVATDSSISFIQEHNMQGQLVSKKYQSQGTIVSLNPLTGEYRGYVNGQALSAADAQATYAKLKALY